MLKTSVNHNLCIFYQHFCGLRTKIFISFLYFLRRYVLTETWLSPVISSNELGFDGFPVFRQRRNFSNSNFSCGGGILIAVKIYLNAAAIPLDNVDVEQTFVTLTLDSFRILVGTLITTHWFFLISSLSLNLKFHISSVEQLILPFNPRYSLFCGDYNIPQVS